MAWSIFFVTYQNVSLLLPEEQRMDPAHERTQVAVTLSPGTSPKPGDISQTCLCGLRSEGGYAAWAAAAGEPVCAPTVVLALSCCEDRDVFYSFDILFCKAGVNK